MALKLINISLVAGTSYSEFMFIRCDNCSRASLKTGNPHFSVLPTSSLKKILSQQRLL